MNELVDHKTEMVLEIVKSDMTSNFKAITMSIGVLLKLLTPTMAKKKSQIPTYLKFKLF